MNNFDKELRDFINSMGDPTLDELEQRHKELQKRIDEQIKEPLNATDDEPIKATEPKQYEYWLKSQIIGASRVVDNVITFYNSLK